jgi:protein-S-isoprenylcysteine O-methyltransferase Ste14
MPLLALGVYLLFAAVAFGWRTWRQYRTTGDHGFRGLSGRTGSLEWCGGLLLSAAMVLAALAPLAQAAGFLPAIHVLESRRTGRLGLGLALTGFALTVAAQLQMRASWRIGVDEGERTQLVTGGPFAVVRNPIFSGMLLVLAGMVMMAPTVPALLAFVFAAAGIEIQVRRVEEPYLIRVHGEPFQAYARRVGRFVPGVGTRSSFPVPVPPK